MAKQEKCLRNVYLNSFSGFVYICVVNKIVYNLLVRFLVRHNVDGDIIHWIIRNSILDLILN